MAEHAEPTPTQPERIFPVDSVDILPGGGEAAKEVPGHFWMRDGLAQRVFLDVVRTMELDMGTLRDRIQDRAVGSVECASCELVEKSFYQGLLVSCA